MSEEKHVSQISFIAHQKVEERQEQVRLITQKRQVIKVVSSAPRRSDMRVGVVYLYKGDAQSFHCNIKDQTGKVQAIQITRDNLETQGHEKAIVDRILKNVQEGKDLDQASDQNALILCLTTKGAGEIPEIGYELSNRLARAGIGEPNFCAERSESRPAVDYTNWETCVEDFLPVLDPDRKIFQPGHEKDLKAFSKLVFSAIQFAVKKSEERRYTLEVHNDVLKSLQTLNHADWRQSIIRNGLLTLGSLSGLVTLAGAFAMGALNVAFPGLAIGIFVSVAVLIVSSFWLLIFSSQARWLYPSRKENRIKPATYGFSISVASLLILFAIPAISPFLAGTTALIVTVSASVVVGIVFAYTAYRSWASGKRPLAGVFVVLSLVSLVLPLLLAFSVPLLPNLVLGGLGAWIAAGAGFVLGSSGFAYGAYKAKASGRYSLAGVLSVLSLASLASLPLLAILIPGVIPAMGLVSIGGSALSTIALSVMTVVVMNTIAWGINTRVNGAHKKTNRQTHARDRTTGWNFFGQSGADNEKQNDLKASLLGDASPHHDDGVVEQKEPEHKRKEERSLASSLLNLAYRHRGVRPPSTTSVGGEEKRPPSQKRVFSDQSFFSGSLQNEQGEKRRGRNSEHRDSLSEVELPSSTSSVSGQYLGGTPASPPGTSLNSQNSVSAMSGKKGGGSS